MGKIYGYVRISTKKQNMERQIRNIQKEYPEAVIIKEVYTGTKFQGRKELNKLIKQLKAGDTVVFDSVSRMSRDAEEATIWNQFSNWAVWLFPFQSRMPG